MTSGRRTWSLRRRARLCLQVPGGGAGRSLGGSAGLRGPRRRHPAAPLLLLRPQARGLVWARLGCATVTAGPVGVASRGIGPTHRAGRRGGETGGLSASPAPASSARAAPPSATGLLHAGVAFVRDARGSQKRACGRNELSGSSGETGLLVSGLR